MRIDYIIKSVCDYYRVNPADLPRKKNGGGKILKARKAVHYLSRKTGLWTLKYIGDKTERGHAAVMSNIKTIQMHMDTNKVFKMEIELLWKKIQDSEIAVSSKDTFKEYIMQKYKNTKQDIPVEDFLINELYDILLIS